jgi:hypothetical protein
LNITPSSAASDRIAETPAEYATTSQVAALIGQPGDWPWSLTVRPARKWLFARLDGRATQGWLQAVAAQFDSNCRQLVLQFSTPIKSGPIDIGIPF